MPGSQILYFQSRSGHHGPVEMPRRAHGTGAREGVGPETDSVSWHLASAGPHGHPRPPECRAGPGVGTFAVHKGRGSRRECFCPRRAVRSTWLEVSPFRRPPEWSMPCAPWSTQRWTCALHAEQLPPLTEPTRFNGGRLRRPKVSREGSHGAGFITCVVILCSRTIRLRRLGRRGATSPRG